jgi:hypothetical protein
MHDPLNELDIIERAEDRDAQADPLAWYAALADTLIRDAAQEAAQEAAIVAMRADAHARAGKLMALLADWKAYRIRRDLHAEWRKRLEDLPF